MTLISLTLWELGPNRKKVEAMVHALLFILITSHMGRVTSVTFYYSSITRDVLYKLMFSVCEGSSLCLTTFVLLQQNTTAWIIYKQ
jgi:tetrahydromethanopterin S-methyltransferase subunit E